ncbi:MAG: putative lipoprotein, partial [Nevskia sp.]|nr:putative lipoprotein [Nevskia sp.]
ADLSRALGVRDVYGLTFGNGIRTYRVTLKVQRFDSALGGYARIDAVWTVHPLDQQKTISTCSSRVSQPVGPGYDGLAQGHQQAIDTIAKQIAAAITALQSGQTAAACPV